MQEHSNEKEQGAYKEDENNKKIIITERGFVLSEYQKNASFYFLLLN